MDTGTRIDAVGDVAPGPPAYPPLREGPLPALREGRGVAVLDEIEAAPDMAASVNRLLGEAAGRSGGLVKLPYLLLPLPWPRLTYAHAAGANGTPELAEEVRRHIEGPLVQAVQAAARRGLLPPMALMKIAHYPADLDDTADYCDVPHEDGPLAAPGNTMLWYLLGEPADVEIDGSWLPLSTAHPNVIGSRQVHRAPSPARLRAEGRPSARTLIAVFGQNGPIGGLYAWAGMLGMPDVCSAIMAQAPGLASVIDRFYGGSVKLLEQQPALRSGVERYLTVVNAAWNLHPGVRLVRDLLNRRSD